MRLSIVGAVLVASVACVRAGAFFGQDATVLTPSNFKKEVLDSSEPWIVGFYGEKQRVAFRHVPYGWMYQLSLHHFATCCAHTALLPLFVVSRRRGTSC